MAKYRNIPQATKDNVLHYINQVYDEAYELGYQRGRVQSDRDIENAQQMVEDAIKRLHELKQVPKRGYWLDAREEDPCWFICSECKTMVDADYNYCPHCGCAMERGEEE